jgi:hypothetical protein
MRGIVYRSAGRRIGSVVPGIGAGSIVLAVGTGLALVLAILLSSASAAFARAQAAPLRAPVVVIAVTHAPAVKLPPAVLAHAAGHKIA